MNNIQHLYKSYLLRLWQTKGEDGMVWRASLSTPDSGEHRGFANLQALFAYLEEITGQTQSQSNSKGGTP